MRSGAIYDHLADMHEATKAAVNGSPIENGLVTMTIKRSASIALIMFSSVSARSTTKPPTKSS